MRSFYLTGNNDGSSIEECIKKCKPQWENSWRLWIDTYFKDDAKVWWCSLDSRKMKALSDEEFEQVFLDKWSHAKNKYQVGHKGLFSILKFHGCIQKENILVSTSPSCKHNFIHVNLAKKLQVCAKHIQITHVDGENFQIFKYLKITMDKYVLHS